MMYNITKYDYERISFKENSDHDSFKILTGQFSGTIVTYGRLSMEEITNDNTEALVGKLSFEYEIEKSPMEKSELQESPAFENYLGDMLTHIIQASFDDGNYKIGE